MIYDCFGCLKIRVSAKKNRIGENCPNQPFDKVINSDTGLNLPSTQRRRSNTPPRDVKYQKLQKRRLTEIPHHSIEEFLQRKINDSSHPLLTHIKKCPKGNIYLHKTSQRFQDRRQSTPAVFRQANTLSESLNRLALGNLEFQLQPQNR